MTPAAIDIARDFIARWEGIELQVYKDSAGLDTIGVGHLVRSSEDFSEGITEAEALAILEADMHEAIQCVDQNVDVDLDDAQAAALCSFCFNLGCRAFNGSTLLRLLNQGNYRAASNQFQKWCNAGGKPIPGLLRRRLAEKALFDGGIESHA